MGIVASFSSTQLVFEDGTTFVIDENTDVETTLSIGLEVEVDSTTSGGVLTATGVVTP